MRKLTKFKRISITEDLYHRLIKDRNNFQKIIGGGRWSISDTIFELYSIINTYKESNKKSGKGGSKK